MLVNTIFSWDVASAIVLVSLLAVVWYSPLGFGRVVAKSLGLTQRKLKQKQPQIRSMYFLNMLGIGVMVVGSKVVYQRFNITSYDSALTISVCLWLFFVMPIQFSNWVFSERPSLLLVIDSLYLLFSQMVIAAVLIGL